ncbi:uncharacterized protein LOC123989180 [Osmia bicornis bicornis]|uniref:uncharacterized protein LOC123989180 n=1 Tax=Osmia bicornis bicornis TaxID=1437191 RepID=UPI001EAF16F1|nr:uncharacterized protein LOC123989180 [Osmia bicornis bicornis]
MDRIYQLKPMRGRKATSLVKMTNIIGETTEAMKAFGLADPHNCYLVRALVRLLDADTREHWEHSLASQKEYPTMEQLTSFLLERAGTLEQLERLAEGRSAKTSSTPSPRTSQTAPQWPSAPKATVHTAAGTQPTPAPASGRSETSRPRTSALYPCACCTHDHFLAVCPAFRQLTPNDRADVIRDKQLCVNCLGHHNLRSCRTSQRCKLCNEQHHTVLHGSDLSRVMVPRLRTAQTSTSTTLSKNTPAPSTSESLVNQLRLRRQRSSLDVHGVGGARTSQTNGVVNITLHSNYRPLSVTVHAHVLTKVTTCLPSDPPALPTLPSHLEKLNLADPQFLRSRPVDIILGGDAYGQVIKSNIIRHASSPLIAQLSIFGWLIIGPLEGSQTIRRTSHQVTVNNTDRQLSELLSRFSTQKEPPQDTAPLLTPDEQECEDHFKTTHSRNSAGRYIVRLPLKIHPRALGNSYQTAHSCLQRTLRRFSKDAQYKQLYTKFMLEYEQLGHMVGLNNDSITSPFQYFLPHHGVLKLGSGTTALRVVFNGSSPTSSGYSLNDLLHTGPNLMLNIADLLIWIRRYKHLFATDVTKMYRQIKVHPDDWSLQQILWLDDAQQETQYQLTTVTYGTKAAPYLAVQTLLQLAEDEGSKYPLAVEPIKNGRAKILIQELWLQELGWDDILSCHITQQWLRIREDLTSLARLSIPRWFNTTTTSTVELHGFSDASVLAMAAVVYLVVHAPSTGTHTFLICAKTRVTPLKRLTIPRLELTAALLLSKLMRHVHVTLNLTVSQTFLWTDSEVTLAWIKTHPSKWKDYVRNRVIQIQEITQNYHWRHVPGSSNPADCASRGMSTEQLQQHSLWCTGSPWHTQLQNTWPKQTSVDVNELGAPEARAVVSLHTANASKGIFMGINL